MPPVGAEVSVVVPDGHIDKVPETGDMGLTDTKMVRLQPVGRV